MSTRSYLAGICSVLLLIGFGASPSSASQKATGASPTTATASSVSHHDHRLAFAPPEDDDKPRKRRPKRVKDDDNLPAKKAEPKKEAPKNEAAKAGDNKDAKPAEPQPPALIGPTTVSTPQESLAIFSIRVLGRIGGRLAGTPVVAESRPTAPKAAAKADSKKGANDDKGKMSKKGNTTAQNDKKKGTGPGNTGFKFDPKRFKGFRKGDSNKRR